MKEILTSKHQEFATEFNEYNAYEVNLKINNQQFCDYVSSKHLDECYMYQAIKALDLYLNNKNIKDINNFYDTDKWPYYLDKINNKTQLIQYAYDMLNGEYDFPDDYLDTILAEGTLVERMEDDEQTHYIFPPQLYARKEVN